MKPERQGLPTRAHRSGRVHIVLDGYVEPVVCRACGLAKSAEQFLKTAARDREGRAWLSGENGLCARCDPPDPLPCESGMRIAEIRAPGGEPLRWRQRTRAGKFGRWHAMSTMELRRMTPGGNTFRPQPRQVRSARSPRRRRAQAQPGMF